MTSKDEYKKITLHISDELLKKLDEASVRLKLSKGTIIREAINSYIAKDDGKK